jgi:hypothetical protein
LNGSFFKLKEVYSMATFVLLYSGGGMPQGEAETKKVMEAWGQWSGKHAEAIVDLGNPFGPVAKTITADGKVTDGSAGTRLTGYSIIKADSVDKAVAIAKECPVFLSGDRISLLETFDVMAAAEAR